MYSLSVPVFNTTLANLSAILDKAAAHAEARKIDPAVLLSARLYPDMLPFTKQIQIASDSAKGGAARLTGAEPPAFEDSETTFAELKARIARTREYLATLAPEKFAGAEERAIELKMRNGTRHFVGLPYLAHYVLPNFFFHTTTAYAILRHNGVELGKMDFLGNS